MDSGNSSTPHPAFATAVAAVATDVATPATAAAGGVVAAVATDVATAATAAAGGVVAASVASGAFFRFAFDFFPMTKTIQIRLGIIPGTVDASKRKNWNTSVVCYGGWWMLYNT